MVSLWDIVWPHFLHWIQHNQIISTTFCTSFIFAKKKKIFYKPHLYGIYKVPKKKTALFVGKSIPRIFNQGIFSEVQNLSFFKTMPSFYFKRNLLMFPLNTMQLWVNKAVLSVRKQLTYQLPEGRFGPKICANVPILLYFVRPKCSSGNCNRSNVSLLTEQLWMILRQKSS